MLKKRLLGTLLAAAVAVTSLFSLLTVPAQAASEMWEPFNYLNTSMWTVSDGYKNGDTAFGCYWRRANVSFDTTNGVMNLKLDKTNTTYYGGEIKSNYNFSYGYYETNMVAQKHVGTISSFFTYTGPSYGTVWDEIDIEFLGKMDANGRPILQLNYYKNGVGGNEQHISLGFDASAGYHKYGFDWRAGSLKWFVDGKQVGVTKTTNIPTTPSRIMMNLWCIDNNNANAVNWVGRWDGITPVTAKYDYVKYTP